MRFVQYTDRAALASSLATCIADDLKQALALNGRAALAVAGGTSPGPVFDALAEADIDWANVTILPSDERWVPPTHDRSNAALIGARLLRGRAAAAQMLAMYTDGATPETALPGLTDALRSHMPLASVLLGMGEDMHTASLFPGTQGLEQALAADAPPLAVLRPASQPEARITLSAPTLRAAQARHLLIFGAEKRAALDRATTLPPTEAPVAAILGNSAMQTTVHWAE